MARLYVGLVAPKTYVLDFVPGFSSLDLSTVSAATIQVRKPDGTTTSWSTALSNQTASTITLTYSIPSSTPFDQAGTWSFYVKFTIPGGYDRTEEWTEQVLREHGGA